MALSASTAAAGGDQLAAVRAAIAAKPDGVLEMVAAEHGVAYRAVLDCLDGDGALAAPATTFDAVWEDMTSWGTIMFIVHTADGVFETAGTLPPGSHARGYFNIHGDSPIGGHLKIERCAAIYFVDRPFFGRRSCSVQFLNGDGEAMFKVFVGRDESRELRPDQVAKFEALRAKVRGAA
jgi:putative heme utilization carrier protein HutX